MQTGALYNSTTLEKIWKKGFVGICEMTWETCAYTARYMMKKQMAQLQRENWDYTNAENQRKHYENAGLNVGLMYGSSGGGGATMGGGSGV